MRVRYTLPALADLASILDYIADRSPQGALRIQRRIQVIINLLLQYPWAGAPTEDPSIRRMTTSRIPISYSMRPPATKSSFTRCVMAPATFWKTQGNASKGYG